MAAVIVIIIATTGMTGNPSQQHNVTWSSENGTEPNLNAAIGIAPNRGNVRVDAAGRVKPTW
jgi:hypothetical protein